MPYQFSVANVSHRSVDAAIIGAVISVKCEKTDNGNVLGESELTWFAEKAEFPTWPPSKAETRAYIVSYLQGSEPGIPLTRAAKMEEDTATIEDDPQAWTPEEPILPDP